MAYNLEIPKIIKKIKDSKAKTVLLQFPDGLKPKGTEVAKELEKKTKAKIYIWLGSNFGACDIPNVKVDLIINFGHSKF